MRSETRAFSGVSPAPISVTSRTTTVPAGITAPFSPTTSVSTVAVILSPGRFVVHTADFVRSSIAVPEAMPRNAGFDAVGAGDGTTATGGRSGAGDESRVIAPRCEPGRLVAGAFAACVDNAVSFSSGTVVVG